MQQSDILNLAVKIQAKIDSKTDNRIKTIGDRVIIWDWSYSLDTKGKHHNRFTGHDEEEGIIIKTNLHIKTAVFFNKDKFADILVLFPNGDEIYTSSKFVSRTDNYSK
jgi:hypothetical protein